MMEIYYEFSKKKDLLLKISRGVSFEEVMDAIANGNLLDTINHSSPQYKHQKIFIVEIKGYAYLVPYVKNGNAIFLKTIFPSRKATKYYLSGGNHNEKTEI